MSSLSADDETWFRDRPHREFRCRRLTPAERVEDDAEAPAAGLVRLAYVRRRDGAMVKVWTPSPDMLLNEEDEGRARFFAQYMPNPPPLDAPIQHIDFDAIASPTEATVKALADDACARGTITAERHAAILAEPEAHVVPQINLADMDAAGPRVRFAAKINPAFLAEVGLPERLS